MVFLHPANYCLFKVQIIKDTKIVAATYLCKYSHVEESIPSFKIKWFAKDDNSLLASCFKRELPVLVACYNRVGNIRIWRVWAVAIHGLDSPEDGQTNGCVLINGHIVAWNVSAWCEYDIYPKMLSH